MNNKSIDNYIDKNCDQDIAIIVKRYFNDYFCFNNSEQRAKVRNYIIDCIDFDGYNIIFKTPAAAVKIFESEIYKISKNLPSIFEYFIIYAEHLRGLPSIFNIEFVNYNILQLAKKWKFKLNTEDQEDAFLFVYWLFLAIEIASLKERG